MLALSRPLESAERRDHAAAGAVLAAWLGYTAAYPALSTVHATLPACPFYTLTGHPCPFCGGTRSYAAMWHGDVAAAARLYPLGPALFVLTFAALAYLGWAALGGRQVVPSPVVVRAATIAALVALAVSWGLKLAWLGN
jgi:hypothetical protein